MIYSKVKSNKCESLECMAEVYNLFAVFNAPVNVIFVDQFINNIYKFKDVFRQYFNSENIFFSCKSNKSLALLNYAARYDCGIEVSSNYELEKALKHTNRIIASGPEKDEIYLNNAIDNNVIISVDDIEELKTIKKL